MRRVPDPEDARAKVVRLTARGRRFVAEAWRASAAVEAGLAATWAIDATRRCATLEELMGLAPEEQDG